MSKILLSGKELENKIDQFLDRKSSDVFEDDVALADKLRAIRHHMADG